MSDLSDYVGDMQQMHTDAGKIIQHRVTLMLTGTMSAAEANEMVAEKAEACQCAMNAYVIGCFALQDPLTIMRAMLAPYRAKTAKNRGRFGC